MAGVGMTSMSTARAPTLQMPATSALSSISPLMRVSRPTRMVGRCTSLASTAALACPRR
jgi:hypothetical protein